MNECIVYLEDSGSVCVMWPCDCGLTTREVGMKDVPAGSPFWLLPVDQIPSADAFRGAWEIDVIAMGEPSGYGAAK